MVHKAGNKKQQTTSKKLNTYMKKKTVKIAALMVALVSASCPSLLASEGQQQAGVQTTATVGVDNNCPNGGCMVEIYTYYGCDNGSQAACTPYTDPQNPQPVSGSCVWNGSWWDCAASS